MDMFRRRGRGVGELAVWNMVIGSEWKGYKEAIVLALRMAVRNNKLSRLGAVESGYEGIHMWRDTPRQVMTIICLP